MLKLSAHTNKLPDLKILSRYDVPPHAYGFCPECDTFFDYWRYGDTDFMCPYGCGTMLRELNPIELAEALGSCEQGGCFREEFLYATSLRPLSKQEKET